MRETNLFRNRCLGRLTTRDDRRHGGDLDQHAGDGEAHAPSATGTSLRTGGGSSGRSPRRTPRSPSGRGRPCRSPRTARAGVPGEVALERADLLVPSLARVPDLLVAERYPAGSTRFAAALPGTLLP